MTKKPFITNNDYLPLAFFVFTFSIGLLFNLVFNPFKLELYPEISDYMDGYIARADLLLSNPFSNNRYLSFFPPGTDLILMLMKLIFGKNNFIAIDILYAFFGAGSVAFAYCIAESASRFKTVPIIVGLLAMINISFYAINSFFSSQTPYCFFMMASIWSLFKLIDCGNAKAKTKHAILTGLLFGIAALIRPEILLFIFLLLIYFLFEKKYFVSISLNFKYLIYTALLFNFCLLLASVKFFVHTNQMGFISENFSYNLVFGRCHNIYLQTSNGDFFSPAMKYLHDEQIKNQKFSTDVLLKLDPALDTKLSYNGQLHEHSKHLELISQCINKAGLTKQIQYSFVNMLLLWLTPLWMLTGHLEWLESLWSTFFNFCFMIPSFISLLLLFNIFKDYKKNIKLNIIILNYLSILITSAIVFGENRFLTSYEFNITIIVLELYFIASSKLYQIYKSYKIYQDYDHKIK